MRGPLQQGGQGGIYLAVGGAVKLEAVCRPLVGRACNANAGPHHRCAQVANQGTQVLNLQGAAAPTGGGAA